jgi:hypothetical protein
MSPDLFTIEDGALLSVTSGGSLTGSGAGNSEKGASYGGEGGSNTGTTNDKLRGSSYNVSVELYPSVIDCKPLYVAPDLSSIEEYSWRLSDDNCNVPVDSTVIVPNGASLSLKTPLTANKLTSDGSGSVTLSNNAHMTISEFDALNHGCQCNFDVELGSTLQVDTDFDQ